MSNDTSTVDQHTNLERGMGEIPNDNVEFIGENLDEFTGEIPANDEISEDDEIKIDFQNPPSNEHLWDGLRYQWVHQNEIPIENRPQRWHLYKQNMHLQSGY